MNACNHNWSAETHEGVPSRVCHSCNEWEIELELATLENELTAAKAAIIDAALIHAKMLQERDEARDAYKFRGGYIEDASGDRWWSAELLAKVERERDEARSMLLDADSHIEELKYLNRKAQAEIEMLRGVGCREAKEGEPESGPCGVCLRCAEERGVAWALDAALNDVINAPETPGGHGYEIECLDVAEVCRKARAKEGREQ